jgi:hypothetical protein
MISKIYFKVRRNTKSREDEISEETQWNTVPLGGE